MLDKALRSLCARELRACGAGELRLLGALLHVHRGGGLRAHPRDHGDLPQGHIGRGAQRRGAADDAEHGEAPGLRAEAGEHLRSHRRRGRRHDHAEPAVGDHEQPQGVEL